jgi:hypothetical protein
MILFLGLSGAIASRRSDDDDANVYVHTVGKDQRDAVEKVAGILRPNASNSEANPQYVN